MLQRVSLVGLYCIPEPDNTILATTNPIATLKESKTTL